MGGVWLDAGAQAAHQLAQRLAISAFDAPNMINDRLARQNLTRVQEQQVEQAAFQGREHDGRAVAAPNLAPAAVEGEVAHLTHRRRQRFAGAAQDGQRPRHQLTGTERLGHVIIRAQVKAANDVILVVAHGQHDDGRRGLGADTLANRETVHFGQVDIQDDQVRLLCLPAAQRGLPVEGAKNLEAGAAQGKSDEVSKHAVIINDKRLHPFDPIMGILIQKVAPRASFSTPT